MLGHGRHVRYWYLADNCAALAFVRYWTKADIKLARENEKPRRSRAFKSLTLLRGLASGSWLGRLRSASFGVLSYTVIDEVAPIHEVDGGILLGGLSFAGSLDICRLALGRIPWLPSLCLPKKTAGSPAV